MNRPRPDADQDRLDRWLRDESDWQGLQEELEWRADRRAEMAPFGPWPLIEGEAA